MNIDEYSAFLPGLLGLSKDTSANFIWLVPRIVNNLFTGRTETLTKIMNAISNSRCIPRQQRFIITGMGSQGKSEFVYRLQTKHDKST